MMNDPIPDPHYLQGLRMQLRACLNLPRSAARALEPTSNGWHWLREIERQRQRIHLALATTLLAVAPQ